LLKERAYQFLERLGIEYKKYEHPPLLTCDDAKKHRPSDDFLAVKNLFVQNRKCTNLYLYVLPAAKRADLNYVREKLQESKLSFVEGALLMDKLKVTQGAVSLLNLINLDDPADVVALIDREVFDAKQVGFHPSVNTETLVFATADISKIIDAVAVKWQII